MSKHDVTQSSNPDVQVLLALINALAIKVAAIEGELASLPEAFVVPGPNGEIPTVVKRVQSNDSPDVLLSTVIVGQPTAEAAKDEIPGKKSRTKVVA